MREIITADGPDAVAFYASGQLLTEEYYLGSKLARGSSAPTTSTRTRGSAWPRPRRGTRAPWDRMVPPASYQDIDLAECFLLLGTNTADCHPVTSSGSGVESSRRPTT